MALSKATSVGVMPSTLPKMRSSFVRTTRSRPLSTAPRAGNWMSRIAAVRMPTSWSKKGPENRTTPLAMLLTDPVSRSPERPKTRRPVCAATALGSKESSEPRGFGTKMPAPGAPELCADAGLDAITWPATARMTGRTSPPMG